MRRGKSSEARLRSCGASASEARLRLSFFIADCVRRSSPTYYKTLIGTVRQDIKKHAFALAGFGERILKILLTFQGSGLRPPKLAPSVRCGEENLAKLAFALAGFGERRRRRRDSNPRHSCQYTAFRVRPIQPLWHFCNGRQS